MCYDVYYHQTVPYLWVSLGSLAVKILTNDAHRGADRLYHLGG